MRSFQRVLAGLGVGAVVAIGGLAIAAPANASDAYRAAARNVGTAVVQTVQATQATQAVQSLQSFQAAAVNTVLNCLKGSVQSGNCGDGVMASLNRLQNTMLGEFYTFQNAMVGEFYALQGGWATESMLGKLTVDGWGADKLLGKFSPASLLGKLTNDDAKPWPFTGLSMQSLTGAMQRFATSFQLSMTSLQGNLTAAAI